MSRAVRIGIIDSGVNLAHSHIGNIAGGVTIASNAADPSSYVDHLGHGTAVASLLHERAPHALLFAVRVFHQALATNLASLLSAIDWCLDNGMDLINLSLGTTNAAHHEAFEAAVTRVQGLGKAIVSAYEMQDIPALPGSLPGVVGVLADSSKKPDGYGVGTRNGKAVFTASPFPREIPGVPRERNLHGVSFAVANVTATLARLWRADTIVHDWESVLVRHASAHTDGAQAQFLTTRA